MDASLLAIWWGWISTVSIQVCWIAAIVWLTDRCWGRRMSSGLLIGLWSLVWIKFLLPPGLSAPWSIGSLVATQRANASTVVSPSDSLEQSLLVQVGFGFWVIGLLWIASRWAIGWLQLRRMLQQCEPADERLVQALDEARQCSGIQRSVSILVSQRSLGPSLVGTLRPRILLSRELVDTANEQQLVHLLLHELVHAEHRDGAWRRVIALITAVFWFHPVARFAQYRCGLLREVRCDARVSKLIRPEAYRETLLRVASFQWLGRSLEPAFLARPSQLMERIRWLEQGASAFRWTRSSWLAGGFCAVVALATWPVQAFPVESARAVADTKNEIDTTADVSGNPVLQDPSKRVTPVRMVDAKMLADEPDLKGCLPRRYLVFGLLADDSADPPPDSSGEDSG